MGKQQNVYKKCGCCVMEWGKKIKMNWDLMIYLFEYMKLNKLEYL